MILRIAIIIILFCQFLVLPVSAQAIDNFSSARNINNDNYFRLHYENDYFTATDLYYTQGIQFEFVHPALNKFPLMHLLIQGQSTSLKNGIALEINGYTPSSIRSNEILYNDHPYAGVLFIKTFKITVDSVNQTRISSGLVTGVIGPSAGGDEIQTSIHRWTGNFLPLGWQHQIKNDLVLNYEFVFEKELLSIERYFLVNGMGSAKVGTLGDKIGAGVILMAGYFNSPFVISGTKIKKISAHIYSQPSINLVGYDATLQGGVFNNNSPYTISANEIERITFQNHAGIVVNINKLYLEYFQSYTSKEFKQGISHLSGGIRIGVSF